MTEVNDGLVGEILRNLNDIITQAFSKKLGIKFDGPSPSQ